MSDEGSVHVTIDDGDGNDAPRLRPRDAMRSEAASAAEAAAALERQESWRRVAAAEAQQVEAYAHATRAEGDLAERDFKLSFESGDVAGMAAAQRRLASSEARTVRLEELATSLKKAPPAAPLDPVEAYIRPRTAPTQAWLRNHTEFITDRSKNAKLTAAHYDALANEIPVDTPEYFAHVERYIGAGDGRSGGVRRISSAAAVGANPSDFNTHDLRGGGVYLTAGERQRATDGTIIWNYGPRRGEPIGLQEYARRKQVMIRQGQYKKLED